MMTSQQICETSIGSCKLWQRMEGVGAYRIRIAALMKNATSRDTVLSHVPYLMAILLPSIVRGYPLVWMMLECKYRLWGITVAPAQHGPHARVAMQAVA